MLDLYDELRRIVDALDGGGVAYALVGGIAVSIYARPRATEDVDLLIGAEGLTAASGLLAPLGYRELSVPMRLSGGRIEIRRFTRLAGNDFMVLDLLLATDDELREILSRRVATGPSGSRLWLAPLDGLRRLKRLRGSPQDLADLTALEDEPEGLN